MPPRSGTRKAGPKAAEPARNPFVFGGVVGAAHFVDREPECRQLEKDLRNCEKVFLISPRRFGKSSLVARTLEQLPGRSFRTATLSVANATTFRNFLERFTATILAAAGPWEQVQHWVVTFVKSLKLDLDIDPWTHLPKVSLGHGASFDPTPLAPDIFALPGHLTARGRFRLVICLDEFQQIRQFNGQGVEHMLREATQRQPEVGYVIAGSQTTLMQNMLAPDRPFYKAGPTMLLKRIPPAAWIPYIKAQFHHQGRVITEAAVQQILATADLVPYDVQRLAHEVWEFAEDTQVEGIDQPAVVQVTAQVVTRLQPVFEERWESLPPGQRLVLQAIAAGQATKLYANPIRERFRLGPMSSVQKALQLLVQGGVLDLDQHAPFFVDPLFAEWIRGHRDA